MDLSATYSHTAYRHWESDTDVIESKRKPEMCEDIAHQLIHGYVGRNLKVILGGGRKKLLPSEAKDEEGIPGERSDRANLIEAWIQQKKNLGVKAQYVSNREQLLSVGNDIEYLLGECVLDIIIVSNLWLYFILTQYYLFQSMEYQSLSMPMEIFPKVF